MGVSDKFPNSIFSSKTKASRRKFLFFPFSTFYVSRLTTISEAACTCSRDLNASIGKSTETKRLARKHSKAQDEIYQYQARMSKIRSFPSRWTNFPRLRQKTRCDKSSCHEILDTDPRMVQLAACENNLWATRWICTRSSVHPWMHHLPLSLSLSLTYEANARRQNRNRERKGKHARRVSWRGGRIIRVNRGKQPRQLKPELVELRAPSSSLCWPTEQRSKDKPSRGNSQSLVKTCPASLVPTPFSLWFLQVRRRTCVRASFVFDNVYTRLFPLASVCTRRGWMTESAFKLLIQLNYCTLSLDGCPSFAGSASFSRPPERHIHKGGGEGI